MIVSYSKKFKKGKLKGKDTNFKEKILNKSKITTIREDSHNRWRAGLKIHHAHGSRTPNYECFLLNDCLRVQRILIQRTPLIGKDSNGKDGVVGSSIMVMVDGLVMNSKMVELIAKNDGFDSTEDFFDWFDEDFSGKIIHWTKLKYK